MALSKEARLVPSISRVTGRHRLTIESNALAETARQSRMAIGKRHPLRADAAVATPQPAQRVAQRHRMLCPRQVVSGAHLRIPYAPRPSSTARTENAGA